MTEPEKLPEEIHLRSTCTVSTPPKPRATAAASESKPSATIATATATAAITTPPRSSTKKRDYSAYNNSSTRSTPVMPGGSILKSTFSKALSKTLLGKTVGTQLGRALGNLAGSRTPVVQKIGQRVGQTLAGTPATCLMHGTPPPPPTEAPPVIEQLVPVMLLGPKGSGKTSLIKSWVERIEPSGKEDEEEEDDEEEEELWRMDYYKKDFAFQVPSGEEDNKHCSVRVQLWDCFGLGPDISDEEDILDGYDDWKKVVKTVDTILLTVGLHEDSTAEEICETIELWKTWLDEKLESVSKRPTIELLLTQADRAAVFDWMGEGSTLDQTCDACSIAEWHVATARYGDIPGGVESVDDLFRSLVEKRLKLGPTTDAEDTGDDEEQELLEPSTPPAKRRRTEQQTEPVEAKPEEPAPETPGSQESIASSNDLSATPNSSNFRMRSRPSTRSSRKKAKKALKKAAKMATVMEAIGTTKYEHSQSQSESKEEEEKA